MKKVLLARQCSGWFVPMLLIFGIQVYGQEPLPPGKVREEAAASGKRPQMYEEVKRISRPGFPLMEASEPELAAEVIKTEAVPVLKQQLGLGPAFSLEPKTALLAGNTWIITYSIEYENIPLSDSSSAAILFGVAEDSAASIRARNIPRAGVDATAPTVTKAMAVEAGKKRSAQLLGLPGVEALEASEPTLVFEPGDTKESKASLCWSFTVALDHAETPHKYLYSVKAAGEPLILREQALVQYDGKHAGRVVGPYWTTTPVDTAGTIFLPFLTITRDGGDMSAADQDGKYSFVGMGPTSIRAELRSSAFEIRNDSSSVSQLVALATGDDTAPIDLSFVGSKEHEIAQTSAYYWAQQARQFASLALKPNDLIPVTIVVNAQGTCNAMFIAPSQMRLFRGGKDVSDPTKTCVNRAYADTIFHEYGHGVDFAAGGYTDSAYSEGFGDAMAILFTHSECYGRNTRGTGTCLRHAENNLLWPSSGLEIHEKGRIYSGFVWALVQNLRDQGLSESAAYDLVRRLVLAAAVLNPDDIQHAVELTLTVDDDDGDLSNGTPHIASIRRAAEKKNLWKSSWGQP